MQPAPESEPPLRTREITPRFEAEQTALLVIDPVNEFLSEGGAAWELTKGTVKKNDVVGNLRRSIDAARRSGIPVLFAPMAYTAEDYEQEHWQKRSGINRLMYEKKMFLAGSWGADFHPDLQPQEDEVVLMPHKGTDVFQTDLPAHLARLGTTHLVIAGMTANLCCESTGRSATEQGFDVTFLQDAIGAENLPAYEASIRVNYPLIANAVLKVDEFIAALEDTPGRQEVEEGDEVYGSDHGHIGRVREVVRGHDGNGHFIVPRGAILNKDTYVPLDAITKRSGNEVFVNVPKLVVSKVGWDEPPTAESRHEKNGPPKASVDHLYRSRSPSNMP